MLIDLSNRAKIRVAGSDRVRFLNGQLTNDLREAKPGQTIYACVLTAKGKLCGDLFVTSVEDAFLLDCHPALRETLSARLEKYAIADDVEFSDQTDEFNLFHTLAPKLPEGILPEGIVSRSDQFGLEGYDLLVPTMLKNIVPELLKEPVLTAAELETFRIERGIPEWGHELGEDVIPNEAEDLQFLSLRCVKSRCFSQGGIFEGASAPEACSSSYAPSISQQHTQDTQAGSPTPLCRPTQDGDETSDLQS